MNIDVRVQGSTAQPPGKLAAPSRPERGSRTPDGGNSLPPAAAFQPSAAEAIAQIKAYLSQSQRQLQFQFDDNSGRTILRIVNPESGELIRQVPSEEVVKLAAAMRASGGRLIDEQV